jgi:Ca2+-binding RTX toxin-like protein
MDLSFLPVRCGVFALAAYTPPVLSGGTNCSDYPATFTAARFEQLIGHAGTDLLGGAPGIEVIQALGGDDTLFASGGDQTLAGGPGVDTAVFDALPVRIHASLMKGTANGDGHRTMTGVENLYGSPFDDRLVGDGQANVFYGADGNDTILGRAGVDQLYGGNGVDRCDPGAPGVGESVSGCES